MALQLHVTGRIRYATLHKFAATAQHFADYRRKKSHCVPEIFVGPSGGMNTVLMVFEYSSASDWEREEAAVNADPGYARVATGMPYAEGSIRYELFQPCEDLAAGKVGAAHAQG